MATALSACAALGLRTAYVGAIGTDDNGRRIRDELRRPRHRPVPLRDARRRQPVRRDHGRGKDRRADRVVGPRRRPAADALRGSRAAIASARLVHVDDVDQEAAILRGDAGARGGRAGDERHRSRHRSHRRAGRRGQHADLRRARAAGDHRRRRPRARAPQAAPAPSRIALHHAGAARLDDPRRRPDDPRTGDPRARGGHHRRRRRVSRRLHPRAAARRISPRHPPLRERDGGRQLHAAGGDRLGADAGRKPIAAMEQALP